MMTSRVLECIRRYFSGIKFAPRRLHAGRKGCRRKVIFETAVNKDRQEYAEEVVRGS
jgi:hypothetical protein